MALQVSVVVFHKVDMNIKKYLMENCKFQKVRDVIEAQSY